MAEQRQKLENIFTDASEKEAGMNQDKYELCESSTTDSGFLSGGNLIISGEIYSEEIKEEDNQLDIADSEVLDDDTQGKRNQQSYMRLDSGVDLGLTESFSSLSLKNPDLNDLNSKQNLRSNPRITKNVEQPPWELFYVQDEDGDTQLHIAIVQGYLEVAEALIRSVPHPRLLDTPNDDAQSPLHLAVANGQWLIARWLIVAGAKPCLRNLCGDSPLHLCARTGDVKCLKAIADPVTNNERDRLALSYPQQSYEHCNFDQWNYDGQTCVHVAATYGHLDVLRHFIWYGADINAREGCQGYTPLHYAIARSDELMVNFLLSEKKLNPAVLTYGQRSVLQMGFTIPSHLVEVLRLRGVPLTSTYSSSSDDEYDEDSEDEFYENTNNYQSSIIQASA